MNYSEMLHEFLDNSLQGANEETLFRALATDEELRFELKYLLNMRDAVREDDKAFVVPVASTNAIFSQLGYTTPAVVGVGSAVVASQSGLLPFLKTAGGYLVAAVIGALISTGIFMMSDNSETPRLASTDIADGVVDQLNPASLSALGPVSVMGTGTTGSSAGEVAIAADIRSVAPGVRSRRNTLQSTQLAQPDVSTVDRIVGPDNSGAADGANDGASAAELSQTMAQNSTGTTDAVSATPTTEPAIKADQLLGAAPIGAESPDQAARAAETTDIASEDALEARSREVGDLPELDLPFRNIGRNSVHVELRTQPVRLSEMNPTTAALEGPSTNLLDNISGTVTYGINEHFLLVLEGGKEQYLLNFDETKRNGDVVKHEVLPSVLWAAVGARLNLMPESRFNPFIQGSFGGSEAGQIWRGMGGLQYFVTSNFGLTAAFEWNAAHYTFQNEGYTSPSYGIKTGITLNLFNESD